MMFKARRPSTRRHRGSAALAPVFSAFALRMLAVSVFALTFVVAGQAQVVPTFYAINASTNSIDWTSAVNGLGGTINSNVNFDTAGVGALPLGSYAASDVVTFSATEEALTYPENRLPGRRPL